MKNRLRQTFSCFLGLAVIASAGAYGQQPVASGSDQVAVTVPLAQGQLDALLAPIALYPDQLLAQILMASTYPAEVVEAARFVQQNPSLTGDALDQALRNVRWDPSVISLAAYPQVLLMMNDRLDWTQRLGDAFVANQQRVMDTVQILRSRAQAAGNLQSTPQQTVLDQGGFIDIEPAQPQYVYVPVYDPRVIYGPWLDPIYQPGYWYPPPLYGYPDLSAGIVAGIFFGLPCAIWSNHWGWAHPNWRGRDIDIDVHNNYFANRPQYAGRWGDGRWTPSPDQRNGVAYRDRGRPDRMMPTSTAALQAREPYRGRELPPQQVGTRPVPPSQQAIVRAVVQPQPSAPAVQQPPQRRLPTVAQPQPIAHGVPQAPQAVVRPVQQPQPFQRAMPQAQPATLLPGSQPQPFTPVVQQRPQSVTWPLPQQQPFARPMLQPPQERVVSAPQRQPLARSMPPSYPAIARPAPMQQPIARPTPQRSAAQPSYPPPRLPIQVNANRGPTSRQTTSAPNRFVTSRS
jgi:hypothetical protein